MNPQVGYLKHGFARSKKLLYLPGKGHDSGGGKGGEETFLRQNDLDQVPGVETLGGFLSADVLAPPVPHAICMGEKDGITPIGICQSDPVGCDGFKSNNVVLLGIDVRFCMVLLHFS